MLSGLLITLDILVCLALVAVVLLQRSEGGAFGMGGGPTGLITARGAGDLLTRTTWVLFALFLGISLTLTLVGAREHASTSALQQLKLAPASNSASPLTAPSPLSNPLQAPSPGAPLIAPGPPGATPTESLPSLAAPKPHPAAEAPPTSVLEAPAPKSAPTGKP